jgi:hypothetical protein
MMMLSETSGTRVRLHHGEMTYSFQWNSAVVIQRLAHDPDGILRILAKFHKGKEAAVGSPKVEGVRHHLAQKNNGRAWERICCLFALLTFPTLSFPFSPGFPGQFP